jgi:cyclophilin family peptidyl-prolyl cis-trans isomerase
MRWMMVLAMAACARPELPSTQTPDLQPYELRREPSEEVRELLHSRLAQSRTRAALAAGRIRDAQAVPQLEKLLLDPDAGETAAWALGRIEGGQRSLTKCLEAHCPAQAFAAYASTDLPALRRALRGPAANEAAIAIGVLARSEKIPDEVAAEIAPLLSSPATRPGAAYAAARMPKSAALHDPLETALQDGDAWTRSLAARAWGKQGFESAKLPIDDPDWRVRVEAARALATAKDAHLEFNEAIAIVGTHQIDLRQENALVSIALLETAAQLKVLAPTPLVLSRTSLRCAAAQSRDRVRQRLLDTPFCASHMEPAWRSRARAGALAAELKLEAETKDALADPDGRVRGATVAAAGEALAIPLLNDADPYVVQEAAGALAKSADPRVKQAALEAVHRLATAHEKAAGDPRSDALTSLVAITGPLPELLPTPNAALAAALKAPPVELFAPEEAREHPEVRQMHLHTVRGELIFDLFNDVAPLTTSMLFTLNSRGFYDGLDFHRVVPDFVAQGGDPRGDGDGGPGWAIPDEHSPRHFLRGTLGIATNGPETGGSQFFFCHSAQPHLDGRYTVAGQLRPESLPGDRIVGESD